MSTYPSQYLSFSCTSFLPGISLITSNLNKIGHGSYAVKKVFDDLKIF